jgi:hypothetical protein
MHWVDNDHEGTKYMKVLLKYNLIEIEKVAKLCSRRNKELYID